MGDDGDLAGSRKHKTRKRQKDRKGKGKQKETEGKEEKRGGRIDG